MDIKRNLELERRLRTIARLSIDELATLPWDVLYNLQDKLNELLDVDLAYKPTEFRCPTCKGQGKHPSPTLRKIVDCEDCSEVPFGPSDGEVREMERKRVEKKLEHWDCPCGYMMTGPMCIKCGRHQPHETICDEKRGRDCNGAGCSCWCHK